MQIFTQQVVVIGKVSPQGVSMLGTGFFVTSNKIATTRHVVGDASAGLVILAPNINDLNSYQNTADNTCQPINATVSEIDPMKDLAILKTDASISGKLPEIGGFDDVGVSEELEIVGFPHCVQGRRVLTYQKATLGAKVILESNGIESKHAVLNTQARPGQSGSLVFSSRVNKILGILAGAYAPSQGGISLGGIDPQELHQTTHCISAEYLGDMLQ